MQSFRRSVTRQPNGKYRARYYNPILGKWSGGKSGFSTRAAANLYLDGQIAEAQGDTPPPPKEKREMPFERFADDVFWPTDTISAKTRSQQGAIYRNHVKPDWEGVPIGSIELEAVERWRSKLLAKTKPNGTPYGPTAAQAYWIFHKIVMKAVELGYLGKSPFPRKSGIKKAAPQKPRGAFEPHEVEMLAKAIAPKRFYAAVYTLCYGGFRPGENFALRLDDLDWRHNEIAVDESVVVVDGHATIESDLKRIRSHRSVPMPSMVMEILAQHIGTYLPLDAPGDTLIFTGERGALVRPDLFNKRAFKPALVHASLDPDTTAYESRHTAASAWFDEGFDIVEVARFLGCSLRVAEETYVHLFKGRRDQRIGRMDARLARGRQATANIVPLFGRKRGA